MRTARLLITEECNLNCPYCINEVPEVREHFIEVKDLGAIPDIYDAICITGGEPLMEVTKMFTAAYKFKHLESYLYTNGTKISRQLAEMIRYLEFDGVNVGIHPKDEHDAIRQIHHVHTEAWEISDILRFDLQDKYIALKGLFPGLRFRFWEPYECISRLYDEDMYVWRGGVWD